MKSSGPTLPSPFSQIENGEGYVVDEWTGCYPSNWKGMIVPEAMAHPAKYSSRLIRRIYEHLKGEGWVKAGDSVLDPFGGVALGALEAMRHGLNWYGVELEERFVKLAQANLDLWELKFGGMLKGSGHIAQGDSRRLREVLDLDRWVRVGTPPDPSTGHPPQMSTFGEGSAVAVSSPPYAESIQTSERGSGIDYSKAMNGGKGRTLGREAIATGYGSTVGQLGAMKASVSSPPFLQSEGGTPEPKEGGAIDKALYARHAAGNKSAHGYGVSSGQLSDLPEGNFEATVASPPFEDSLDKGWMSAEERRSVAREMGIDNSEHISPVDMERVGKLNFHTYGQTEGQLGSETADDFWSAAREIVEQVYVSLAEGGHAVWVVKDYVKGGQRVPFCDQWRRLCESVGFVTVHEHRAQLVRNRRVQGTLEGGSVELKSESKSFFRRLAEKKGSPRIDWETVYCMVK